MWFWGEKLIFRNFHQKFSIGLTLDSYLSHPNALLWFRILQQYLLFKMTPVSRFCFFCKRSQLKVLSENLQFEINIADFWRKLIKGLYIPKLNIKTCFYSNLMCSFVWKHQFVCQVNIFMFWGKIPYLIKKSHIRRFDSTISSIATLEMLLHLNFYWWFLYWGHLRTMLAWLPLWQP